MNPKLGRSLNKPRQVVTEHEVAKSVVSPHLKINHFSKGVVTSATIINDKPALPMHREPSLWVCSRPPLPCASPVQSCPDSRDLRQSHSKKPPSCPQLKLISPPLRAVLGAEVFIQLIPLIAHTALPTLGGPILQPRKPRL